MSTQLAPSVAKRARRLVKAMRLVESGRVSQVQGTQYHVQGDEKRSDADGHFVDLAATPPCHCGDHLWRELPCKHALAVLLTRANQELVDAVSDLVKIATRPGRPS